MEVAVPLQPEGSCPGEGLQILKDRLESDCERITLSGGCIKNAELETLETAIELIGQRLEEILFSILDSQKELSGELVMIAMTAILQVRFIVSDGIHVFGPPEHLPFTQRPSCTREVDPEVREQSINETVAELVADILAGVEELEQGEV